MKYTKTTQQIEADAVKKIEAEQKKSVVFGIVPDSMETFSVFVTSTSYSADMYLKIEAKSYNGTKPTAETVRDLAAAFPPIPMKRLKGTFLTFLPVAKYDLWSDEKKEREIKEETDIAPFLVDVEPADFSRSASLEWYALTPAGILHIEVVFRLHDTKWLGVSEVEYTKYMGGRGVKSNHFRPNMDKIQTLFDADETPVCQLESPVRWSAGSNETPGKWTLYWGPFSENLTPIEALARVIEP